MIYIKIKEPKRTRKKLSLFKRFIVFFIGIFLPKANPDFEDKIDSVNVWLIEFIDEYSTPNREIGLGAKGETLVKMPDDRNSGYWVDNNLTLSDFKRLFEIEYIIREYFEELWG